MLGRTYDREVCSMARALEVVGERWSLLIVRDALFAGVTRFSDFQRGLGIAPNVLAARLDAFVAAGLMVRSDADYRLTEKGCDLAGPIVALTAWGDRWSDGEPPIRYVHDACGGSVEARTTCAACGPVDDVRAEHGPGMPPGYPAARRAGLR